MVRTMDKTADREVIRDKIYGEMPERPVHLSYKVKSTDEGFAAGKATWREVNIELDFGEREATLPITAVIPKTEAPCPAIVYIGNEDRVPNKFLPVEEIIDRGYAVINICTGVVSKNNADFKSGLCKYIAKGRRRKNAPGKIALWAWGAQRAVDYLSNLDGIDKKKIAVAGHGATAIAALLLAAEDGRIGYVIANDPFATFGQSSGLDAPYLFCPAYAEESVGDGIRELLTLCADKRVMLGSARDRAFADGEGERRIISESGISDYAYHSRAGGEYFSREDWNNYLDFFDKSR